MYGTNDMNVGAVRVGLSRPPWLGLAKFALPPLGKLNVKFEFELDEAAAGAL